MNILVTGGAGFIGSHVVDALIEKGHNVVVIDNLSSGSRENLNPNAVLYEMDVEDKRVGEVFERHKFDIVNHHAAQANVNISVENPVLDAKSNILGLVNLLENSIKYNVRKFINISSGGAIYGDDAELPTKESSKKDPKSPYGISKFTGELFLQFYSRTYGLDYVSLRYSNVYGPRQKEGVISIFISKMLNGEQPRIYGTGNQTRDYIYVKDVVSANLLAMEKGEGEINIGMSSETSVNELFTLVKKIIGYTGGAEYLDEKPGEIIRSRLDITKAETVLGWKPKYALYLGIKETALWYQD
ncbi:TPA: NAD-dependent epimerase/dehydratase family protein [Candidatus Woesearchaeota archaeon]|nr:NAD-dependent epimerase/dehydratase [archaeon GW2011_AR15]MBS3104161.1 NAD-dependent epimerase/dehydratase family protein [Candidatus Woesearchaeota archaeon]HIH41441.1 NAD-dependent epimerase/dehydratase family protein [Candidatus Woesearchaeota archaeon]